MSPGDEGLVEERLGSVVTVFSSRGEGTLEVVADAAIRRGEPSGFSFPAFSVLLGGFMSLLSFLRSTSSLDNNLV